MSKKHRVTRRVIPDRPNTVLKLDEARVDYTIGGSVNAVVGHPRRRVHMRIEAESAKEAERIADHILE